MEQLIALAESLGCGSLKFNHVQSIGRGTRMKADAGLDVEEILALYRKMERDMAPGCHIPLLFDIPLAFRPIRALLKGSLGRCGILGILGVLCGGELSLCGVGVTVPELIYGHLLSDDLAEVWCHAPGLAEFRRLVPTYLGGKSAAGASTGTSVWASVSPRCMLKRAGSQRLPLLCVRRTAGGLPRNQAEGGHRRPPRLRGDGICPFSAPSTNHPAPLTSPS